MNACEITASVTAIANAISCKLTNEELALLAECGNRFLGAFRVCGKDPTDKLCLEFVGDDPINECVKLARGILDGRGI